MKTHKKRILVLLSLLIIVVACAGLTACDGTEDIFAKMMSNEYTDLPKGDTIKDTVWSPSDGYTLELDEAGNVVCTDNENVVCIEKEQGRDFVILNLTDIQLSSLEWDWNASYERIAKETITELVERIKPDLITLTGDQTYGERYAFLEVYKFIDSFGIPWAPTFGNHDNECDELSVATQSVWLEELYDNCLFKAGPSNLATIRSGQIAYGNYIVNVVEKSAESFNVVKSLIMFNSGDTCDYSGEEYDDEEPTTGGSFAHLTTTQLEWYKWAIKGVQKYGKDGKVSSAIFLHIPINAYTHAYAEAINADISAYDYEEIQDYASEITLEQGMNDDSIWSDGYKDSYGVRHEGCGCSPYEDNAMATILDYDDNESTDYVSTDLVVAGHDHSNCTVIKYKGVYLAYGLKTGGGCSWEEEMSGGSVITFGSDGATNYRHEFCDLESDDFERLGIHMPIWSFVALLFVGLASLLTGIVVPILKHKRKKELSHINK